MDFDAERVDEAVLALLYLELKKEGSAWKGYDWDILQRLHEKGYIHNSRNRNKSVSFTEEGLQEGERVFQKLFAERR